MNAMQEYMKFSTLKPKHKEEFLLLYGSRVQRVTLAIVTMLMPLNLLLTAFLLRENDFGIGAIVGIVGVASVFLIWRETRNIDEEVENFLYGNSED